MNYRIYCCDYFIPTVVQLLRNTYYWNNNVDILLGVLIFHIKNQYSKCSSGVLYKFVFEVLDN